MLLKWGESWSDANSSWWAKVNRAKEHIESLRRLASEFRACEPYYLEPESTDKPDRLAYRLRCRQQAPILISTTVGDILHNLRGALESLAFEVARQAQGGSLAPEHESIPTFPICKSPQEFDDFFKSKRGRLFDSRARAAFRDVQHFIILEDMQKHGVSLDTTFEEDAQGDILHRLNMLWNIDKHRRLIPVAYWTDMISWGSNGPSQRIAYRGDGTLEDGSVLLYIEGLDEGMGDRLDHDYNLVLQDDPAFDNGRGFIQDVVAVMEEFYEHIATSVVFPRVFTFMSNDPQNTA